MRTIEKLQTAVSTTRPLQSIVLYLIATAGVFAQTQSVHNALLLALPSLPIVLAGFCLNDYFDFESDRLNHPERALSKHPELRNHVLSIYLLTFIATISVTLAPIYEASRHAWTLLFLLLCNYNYLKTQMPIAKNFYMSLVATCGLYAVDISGDQQVSYWGFYFPFWIACFTRELSFDIPDMAGDDGTLAKKLGDHRARLLMFVTFVVAVCWGAFLLFQHDRMTTLLILFAFAVAYLIMAFDLKISPQKSWIVATGVNVSLGAFIAH